MKVYTEEEKTLKFHLLGILPITPSNEKELSNQIFFAVLVNSVSNQGTSAQTRTNHEKKKKAKLTCLVSLGK